MAGRIKGITIEIGADPRGLEEALSGVNKHIKSTQKELRDVERLLKLDPTNTELLEQRQRLLAKAVGSTEEKLNALKDAEKQAQEQFKRGEISQEQYEALKREIIATEENLKGLEEQASRSNATLAKIGAVADEVAAGANKVASATQGLSTAATAAITASAAASISFEDSIAKVSTLLDTSKTDVTQYKAAMIEASNETGIAVDDFAEAVYSSISASIDQADAIEFTAAMAKLAIGGFTDLSKAVDVTTTVINGYGLAASEAERITDILVATQNLGKTTVDELASSMGKVIPTASAANFSIDELGAAYAQLTKNGIATAEAGTYLRSMLSELTKSGSATDAALRELSGKGFAELKADGATTAEIFSMLSDYAESSGKSLKDMFGSVEAGSAALVLARADGAEFTEMLDAMQESAGSAQKAFDTVAGTTGAQLKRALNQIKNSAIELGDALAPVIEAAANAVSSLSSAFAELSDDQMKTVAGVLAVVAAISPVARIVGGIATAIKGVTVALSFLSANPILLAVGAVGLLTAGIVSMAAEAKVSAEAADDLMTTLKEGGEQLDGTIENIEATASTADRLIDRLDVLNQGGLDESEAAEYNQILSTLCETVPELTSLIDLETGAIEGGTEALRANTNAWRLNAKQQAYQDRLSKLYKENSDALVELQMNTIALAEAKQDLAIAEANETAIRAELTAAYNGNGESIGYLQQKLSEAQGAQAQASSEIERYTELVNQGNIAVDAAAAEIAAEEAAIESLISAESSLTESTTEVVEAQGAVGEAVEKTAMSVEDLAAKYAEAYNSAYSSLSGQVGLFDTFTGEIDDALASTSGMTAAWGEQSANLSAYAENLRLAAVYGIDDGLIASLADGSAESAEYLDQIIEEIEAAGVTTEGLGENAQAFVREFNDAFRQTQMAREQLAAVMAGIESELAETLPEGQAFGNDLVQGMINGINNKSGTLYATMYRTVTEALQSGRRAARSNSPSKETIDLFEDVGEGMIIGMKHKEQDVASAVYDTVSRALALDPHRAAQSAGVSVGAMTGNMLGGASVQTNNTRTVQVTVQNTFGEYDSAAGNAAANDLVRQINRALGRAL